MKYKHSLTRRFLFCLLIVIILSNLLVFAVCYFVTQWNMSRQIMNMSYDLMESNLTVMRQYFEDIDHIAASVIYNKDIIGFLKSEADKTADMELLYSVESLYYNSRPDLQFSFYKEKKYDTVYTIMKGSTGASISDYRYSDWYQEIIWLEENKVLVANREEENTDFVHSVIYRIEDIYENKTVGYLKIDVDLDSLKERFPHDYSQVAGAAIWDEEGELLFYDRMKLELPQEARHVWQGVCQNNRYIMAYGISESTGWHLGVAMSKEELQRNRQQMLLVLGMVLCLMLVVTILLSNRLFNVITINFKRLVDGMHQVRNGNLEIQVEPDSEDEIGALIMEFNEMVERIGELVKNVEAKQSLLKEAEIKALQQQINPHFIHNIMETIMGLATAGMNDEIIVVSECMSDMLRYNTHFENVTTLREEVEQIKNYVSMLKIRFRNRFEVFYDIDEKCMDCRMVKFTLQPLVENAVSHGLSQTYRGGMLRVRVIREEEKISILIFDNGTGIPEDKLEELKRRMQETAERPLDYIDQYKNLGVLNVHLRLKMYYGEEYSMELFSKTGKGTCFSIKIPYQLGKGKDTNVSGNDH